MKKFTWDDTHDCTSTNCLLWLFIFSLIFFCKKKMGKQQHCLLPRKDVFVHLGVLLGRITYNIFQYLFQRCMSLFYLLSVSECTSLIAMLGHLH